MPERLDHPQVVDAWLERAQGRSPEALVELLEATLHALLVSTETTLGDVTLSAIVDRVLTNTVERFPEFASLSFVAGKGVRCDGLRVLAGAMRQDQLRGGLRFVLVELLTVLGNLTAEILTAELHAELSKTPLPGAKGP